MDNLKFQRHTDSTEKTYHKVWTIFNKFYIKLDVKPRSWEQQIILFMGFLVDSKLKSSTVKSYISAIRSVLSDLNVRILQENFTLAALTRACRIRNDELVIRLPIQKDLINLILDCLHTNFAKLGQFYLLNLYMSVFATAYFGLFRIGKVSKGTHVILAKNVHIGENKKKILFILESSKTHTRGNHPQQVKITSSPANLPNSMAVREINPKLIHLCPFTLIKNYLAVRPNAVAENEQFFVFADNSPVLPSHLRQHLKWAITKIGLDNRAYTFHGIRGGRSIDLFNMGVSVETIKKIRRWKSNAVFNYLKT